MASSRSLRVKTTIVASATAVVIPFVPAPSQAHEFNAQSNITINLQGNRFFGKVGSARGICKRNRSVTLFRTRNGRRKAVKRTNTNANGNWSVTARRRGRYQAVVSQRVRSRYAHNHVCRGDRSPTIRRRRRG